MQALLCDHLGSIQEQEPQLRVDNTLALGMAWNFQLQSDGPASPRHMAWARRVVDILNNYTQACHLPAVAVAGMQLQSGSREFSALLCRDLRPVTSFGYFSANPMAQHGTLDRAWKSLIECVDTEKLAAHLAFQTIEQATRLSEGKSIKSRF